MLTCNKLLERDTTTGAHKACPAEAVDEVVVASNGLSYAVPMCWEHRQEFQHAAAAARARRNASNAAAKQRAEARTRGSHRGAASVPAENR